MSRCIIRGLTRTRRLGTPGLTALLSYLLGTAMPALAQAPVTLADQPIFASADVPGNMALALSVEFPTAISVANLNNYADASTYLGYFDPAKCYTYNYNLIIPANSYFQPTAFASGTNGHSCSGQWSGNFMNWATMQTIDPFRWALTGGYRSVDTTTQTILEKAWGANEGSITNFPYRGTTQGTGQNLSTTLISSVTPFTRWAAFNSGIWSNGNMMVFSAGPTGYTTAAVSASDLFSVALANTSSNTAAYRVYVRVSVCDTSVLGVAGLESNCVGYGAIGGTTNYSSYKPQGLMQQYSNKIRFSALSYLNGLGSNDQGGVLREPMGFIGPTYPQPLSTTVITNPRPEWDATTGIMSANPDTASAAASGVTQSGVMNYLNKFGEYGHSYMTYDNVSELYYAAVRYYENLGNVSQWSSGATATMLDGFPAVATWTDPIAYSCQKNFILGIGDDHTWYDYNVGGSTATGGRTKPPAVGADTLNNAATWTTNLQTLEGIAPTPWWISGQGATYYMAGLAYGAHVLDIRPDLTGTQTISTYWMDVMEYQYVENLNPYYLAAKYGGFTVPPGYDITQTTTPLTLGSYDSTGNTIVMNGGQTQTLPDNYFEAGSAQTMVSSLTSAFSNIANAVKAYTTSFSLSTPTIATLGESSFASQYDSSSWTSVITASTLTFASNGTPSTTPLWASSTTLQSQLAGTGWQTGRSVATWNGNHGVPFEVASITTAQLAALVPGSYSSTTTSTQYLKYLRGDRTNEVGSTASGSTKSLRTRTLLLGDIVDAALTPVANPARSYSEGSDLGYAAFKTAWTSRPTMVYAAANDGMLHAFVGSTGVEQFAYVPSALFQGPTATPQVNGLAQLGNPNYSHHYYVDVTPAVFDIDLNRTNGNTSGSPNWHTLLIGGLGKGGKSFYAIDVTNPASMSTETAVASAVAWEFTDSTMGYSFGAPVVVKTVKYGWVVALTSGYDNSDGYGYLYLVNPANGALLEKIRTPSLSSGLAQAAAYVQDYTDYTADSIYVGDLNGQLWRFNLTGTSGSYPGPTQIASLTDSAGNAQPVTTAPLIEVHPTTRIRYVMLGTGRLLSTGDVSSSQVQTFYAIMDGAAGSFKTVTIPVTRATLTQVTDVTQGATIPATSNGWYYDLGANWRVVTGAVAYNGIVAFAPLATSTNACSPSGTSEVYAINYATGTSVLSPNTTGSTTPAPYESFATAITNLTFVSANNTTELIAGTTAGVISQVPANLSGTVATRLLNWLEVPTAE